MVTDGTDSSCLGYFKAVQRKELSCRVSVYRISMRTLSQSVWSKTYASDTDYFCYSRSVQTTTIVFKCCCYPINRGYGGPKIAQLWYVINREAMCPRVALNYASLWVHSTLTSYRDDSRHCNFLYTRRVRVWIIICWVRRRNSFIDLPYRICMRS